MFNDNVHRVPEKKQATLIFAITSPSVEIFLQFLKNLTEYTISICARRKQKRHCTNLPSVSHQLKRLVCFLGHGVFVLMRGVMFGRHLVAFCA